MVLPNSIYSKLPSRTKQIITKAKIRNTIAQYKSGKAPSKDRSYIDNNKNTVQQKEVSSEKIVQEKNDVDVVLQPTSYKDIQKDILTQDRVKRLVAKSYYSLPGTQEGEEQFNSYESKRKENLSNLKQYKKQGYEPYRTSTGEYVFYKKPEQIQKEKVAEKKTQLKQLYKDNPVAGFAHTWTTGVLSWEDPLSLKSLWYAVTGNREGIYDLKAKASLDLDTALNKGVPEYILKVATGPLAAVGSSYGMGAGMGAGVGALKASFPTIGKMAELGISGAGAAMAGKELYQSYVDRTLDKALWQMALTLPAMMSGYKTGHAYGYGKTEAYLYKVHTYQKGSPEYIRFEQALKIADLLKDVKSHKLKPLDFAKDISRLDKNTAQSVMSYLKSHPKTTIGGSGASYTQIANARVPRDIDLLVRPSVRDYYVGLKQGIKTRSNPLRLANENAVKTAKSYIGVDKHIVDIHGLEMRKVGTVHKFWFKSQKPIKMNNMEYMRAGEQLFRKGISSVLKETRYRHGQYPGFPKKGTMNSPKDIADFVTHTRSLISSAKLKLWTKGRGLKAEKHLELFLKPESHQMIGSVKHGSLTKMLIRMTSKPKSLSLMDETGYSSYIYRSYGRPFKLGIGGSYGKNDYGYKMNIMPLKLSMPSFKQSYPSNDKSIKLAMESTSYKSKPYKNEMNNIKLDIFHVDLPSYTPSKKKNDLNLYQPVKTNRFSVKDEQEDLRKALKQMKRETSEDLFSLGSRERVWNVGKITDLFKDVKI